MRLLFVGLALASTVIVAGCRFGGPPRAAAPTPVYAIGVSNGTALTVTLVVNGQAIESFAPGSGTTDPIPASRLGPLPWAVEARSPAAGF